MKRLEIEISDRAYEIVMNDENSPINPILYNAVKNGKVLDEQPTVEAQPTHGSTYVCVSWGGTYKAESEDEQNAGI